MFAEDESHLLMKDITQPYRSSRSTERAAQVLCRLMVVWVALKAFICAGRGQH